jgi:hypothetical protein
MSGFSESISMSLPFLERLLRIHGLATKGGTERPSPGIARVIWKFLNFLFCRASIYIEDDQ